MTNSWPGGYRHAIDQGEHEDWNASHWPGTRQLCSLCDEPTGRCEEDSIFASDDTECERPICEECQNPQPQEPTQ